MKKPKARMDEIELAKSIFDEIIEETESDNWDTTKKASAQKGGKVRAAKLTAAERSAIAKKAAEKRWQEVK